MFMIPDGSQLDDVFDGVPLTDTEKAVYAAFVQVSREHDVESFPLGEVRARVGCTMRELMRALMKLTVFRFISFDEIYDDAGFRFQFCFPDEGEEPDDIDVPDAPWSAEYSAFSTRHGWAMLDAPSSVKLVLAFLHARVGGLDWRVAASQGEIAEYTGLSRKTVSRALKWLADNMVIRKCPGRDDDGGVGACEYAVFSCGVWAQDAH